MNNRRFSSLLKPTKLIYISIVALLMMGEMSAQANSSHTILIAQTPQLPPGTNIDNLPPTPLPGRQQKPTITPLPPVEDFLDSLPNQSPEGDVPESEVEFEVKEFKLEGNTVLDEAAVAVVFQKYRDRSLSFADLLELETELTKLYTDNGYINSGVVIPSQNVNQGVITLQAIEGQIDTINVNVDGRLRENYIRSRLRRGAKSPLNIAELQEALQLLQLNPLVESLNAELSVGRSRDRWLLDVDVNQENAFDPVLFVNNSRTPSVGSFQRGLELNHNNVLGFADRFSFVFKDTDGSDDFDFSYNFPVNSLDGTVGLRYRFINSDIIEGDFDDLDIESETDEIELTLRQPILLSASAESTQEVALGFEFSRQTNEVTLEDIPFPPLSPGADDEGETKISALRFFQDWTKRTRSSVLAARSQVSVGVDIFDATVNEGEPDGIFVAWRGQVQWLKQLQSSSNINLLLRSDIQVSGDDLVPLETFSVGGIQSVRGYRQDVLLGDSGIFASAEVRIPFYRWNDNRNSISAVPFFDFGTAWSNSDARDPEEDTLASLGIGLRLDLIDTLSARIDYGIPLVDVSDTGDSLQEDGLYFSLEYFPF
ncbi:MAG: ShlB/FhaC/HecB family hemolysin secretion/activation protein [Cyanobacteria bacterium P01_G01_bin.67]